MNGVIIYSRKSHKIGSIKEKHEEKNVLSLESQERELIGFAKAKGLKVVAVLRENESAYKPGRSVFDEMIQMFEDGKADTLLVFHLNRIARNPIDGGKVIYFLDEGHLKLIQTPQKQYLNSPEDKFILSIEFAISKKSSDDTSKFIKSNLATKIEKSGEYPGPVPLGYLNITEAGTISGKQFDSQKQFMLEQLNRHLKRIEIDPIDGTIIRTIFENASKGIYTLRELCQHARDSGLRTRKDQKLGKTVLTRMLRNPFYYGAFEYGGILYTKNVSHEALVSKAMWNQVQQALNGRGRQKAEKFTYLFTKVITCGECQGNVSSQTQKGHAYYHCTRWRLKSMGEKCTHKKYYREEWIEDQLSQLLKAVTIPREFIEWSREILKSEHDREIQTVKSEHQAITKQLQNLNTKKDNLLQLKLSPSNKEGQLLSDDEFLCEKERFTREIEKLGTKLKTANSSDWLSSVNQLFDFSTTLSEAFSKGGRDVKREILLTIGKVLLNNGEIKLELAKPYVFLPEINAFWNRNFGSSEPPKTQFPKRFVAPSGKVLNEWRSLWDKIRTSFRPFKVKG